MDDVDVVSARVAVSGYRLTTNGQDLVYRDSLDENGNLIREDADRDIELIRSRLTLGYERIRGTEFSLQVDAEYRPRIGGEGRPDDGRLNALYLTWGMTDRFRRGGPDFGVAVGRLAVREAGYAQADGILGRWRPLERLVVGAFSGFTGNPYGFNWRLNRVETFSTDWITGGAFARWRGPRFQASLAGVYTNTTVPRELPDPGNSDRFYVHTDLGWQPLEDLAFFATGYLDLLPNGQLVQNAEVVGTWTPDRARVSLAVGRFSTVIYEVSTGYAFIVDPAGNTFGGAGDTAPIVDEAGNAVVPFDAARLTAVYNQIRMAGGYQVIPSVEVYGRVNLLFRDVSVSLDQSEAALANPAAQLAPTVDFAPVRLLPTIGARYRNRRIIDGDASVTFVVDEQSQADAILRLRVGRRFFEALDLSTDGRYLLGAINAFDGGVSVGYRFPSGWMPGRLSIRGSFRYFWEDVGLERPAAATQTGALGADEARVLIPTQESFLGFLGLEWRL